MEPSTGPHPNNHVPLLSPWKDVSALQQQHQQPKPPTVNNSVQCLIFFGTEVSHGKVSPYI